MIEEKAALSIMQKLRALQPLEPLMHEFCLCHACPSNPKEHLKSNVNRESRFKSKHFHYGVMPVEAEKNEAKVLAQINIHFW